MLLGNNIMINEINNLASKSIHRAMFYGEQGLNKLSLAKDLACKILQCSSKELDKQLDYIYIGEDNSKVALNDIQNLLSSLSYYPVKANKRVIIINNANLLSIACQNCLLKALEDRLTYNSFIFIAHEPMLPTIHSRLDIINFKPLSISQIRSYISDSTSVAIDRKIYLMMSNGTTSNIDIVSANKELLDVFRNLYQLFFIEISRNIEVLKVFNILKEKDEQSFMFLYKNELPILFCFLYNIFYNAFLVLTTSIQNNDHDYTHFLILYSLEDCMNIMDLIREHETLYKYGNYSKNEYFELVRNLI